MEKEILPIIEIVIKGEFSISDEKLKSNGFHTMMHTVWEMLDKVDINQPYITIHGVKLGKYIKRIPLKSKHTLDENEVAYYTRGLMEVFRSWPTHGHPNWNVRQKQMSERFAVIFERKVERKED